jgi:parvulin-like peptidyl-prolyl isomerase
MAKSAGKKAKRPRGRPERKKGSQEAVRQTKKQIAIGRKQARQNRIIWLSVAGLAALVISILAVGLVSELLVKPAAPVATVNDVGIRADDYHAYLRYQRHNLHANIDSLESGLQGLDPDAEGNEFLISFYQQQLSQLQSMLIAMPQTALDELIDHELVRQNASDLGAQVSTGEIDQRIDEDLQLALAPPPQQPISDTEQVFVPTPIPQEELDDYLAAILESVGISEKQFRAIMGYSLQASKAQETLASQVVTTGPVADLQLIKTDDEAAANSALNRIVAGEDFTEVAKEISSEPTVEETAGALGWVAPSQLSSQYGDPLSDTAFSVAIGEPVVVESNGSWYVILVVDRDDDGPLPEEVVAQLQSSALFDWLEGVKADPNTQIERLVDYAQVPPDPFGDFQVP